MPALRNFKPFFVNSNLSIGNIRCTDADELLRDAAGNTGNSYITYSLIKSTVGNLSGISHIPNILPAVMQDLMERDIINLSVFGIIPQRYRKCDYKRALRGDLGIFLNPEKWKAFLRRFNFALGPRLHGSIAAINAGLPALCTNADSRATEMCKFLKIPHALADLRNYENPITPAEFSSHIKKAYEACNIDAMNAAYPALFENYKNFIESHGIALKSGECMNADMLTDVKMCGKAELSLRRIINKISNSVRKRLKLPGIKKTP